MLPSTIIQFMKLQPFLIKWTYFHAVSTESVFKIFVVLDDRIHLHCLYCAEAEKISDACLIHAFFDVAMLNVIDLLSKGIGEDDLIICNYLTFFPKVTCPMYLEHRGVTLVYFSL